MKKTFCRSVIYSVDIYCVRFHRFSPHCSFFYWSRVSALSWSEPQRLHSFTHSFTPRDNLESSIHLFWKSIWILIFPVLFPLFLLHEHVHLVSRHNITYMLYYHGIFSQLVVHMDNSLYPESTGVYKHFTLINLHISAKVFTPQWILNGKNRTPVCRNILSVQ